MSNSFSNRIFATPSRPAREHFLYVQEVGSLQSLKPHISKRENLSSYLIFVVLKGSGLLHYRGASYRLLAGDCIYIDCQEEYAHESSVADPWELFWVHFYGREASYFYKSYMEQDYSFLFHPSDLSLFLDNLQLLYTTQSENIADRELLCHRYLTDLISLCFLENNHRTRLTDHSIYEKVEQVRAFIDSHYMDRLNLDGLSGRFFISKFHLSREFKRITGSTIGNYILERRIEQAKRQLRFSADSLETIARDCGFSDSSYFIKAFKRAENQTPNEYRRLW